MRVLVDGSGAGLGGITRVLAEVLTAWLAADTIVVTSAPADLPALGGAASVHVLSRQHRSRAATIVTGAWAVWRASKDADVTFSISPSLSALTSRAPVVTLFHDLMFREHPEVVGRGQRLYRGASYRGAAARSRTLLSVSATTAQAMRSFLGWGANRPLVVVPLSGQLPAPPPGPDEPERSELPPEVGSDDIERPLLVAPGQSEHKGVPDLLSALALLPPPWTAVILAGKPAMVERWSALADAHGLADRVRVLGWVSDAGYRRLLTGADLFVSLSEYEGFGLPPVEALYLGTRVLISSVPASVEACGGNAFVVAGREPEAVALAIAEALTAPVPQGSRLDRSWQDVSTAVRRELLAAGRATTPAARS